MSFLTNQKQESGFEQVGGLVTRNISVFCLWQVALYFKAMPNSIDFYKGIFLHVIPIRIPIPCFYQIIKNESPSYLYHLIPKPLTSYSSRNSENLSPIKANHSFVKNTFFLSAIIEWNELDSNISCSPSYKLFRKRILEFIIPQPYTIFHVLNSLGLTYLTRLRVGLSHLREEKFRHNSRDSLNSICNCGSAIESTQHYLLHYLNFKNEKQSLLPNVRIVNPNVLSMNEDALTHLLLYW